MKKILFITTRNPYSGRFSGDVLRSSRIIKLLKDKFNVDIVFLDEKDSKFNNNKGFKNPNLFLKIIYCLLSLIKLQPIQFGLFYSSEFKKYVQKYANNYDLLFFHQIRSVQYFPSNFNGKAILEMGDIYSDNYKQTYNHLKIINPIYYFYLIESFLVRRLEKKSFNLFKRIVLFSKTEIIKIEKKFKSKIAHIPESINNINKIFKYSYKNKKIIFIGNLNYLPNKLACENFIKNIFPKLIKIFPEIEFHIIGNKGKFNKYSLSKSPKIIFLGQKKKIDNHIKGSICGLGNLQIATGVQGKVLTYMSFGLPAICSERSAVNFGSNVLTYNTEKKLINHIVSLKEEKKISQNYSSKSLKFIKKYLWKNVSKDYIKLIKDSL